MDETKHSLYDGAVTLYVRPDHDNPMWQYRMRLPDNEWERKSTKTSDLDKAKEIVGMRWQDVRYRKERGLSVNASFEKIAANWCEWRRNEHRQQRRKKSETMERGIAFVEKKLIPYFKGRNMGDILLSDIDAFHRWQYEQWQQQKNGERIRIRHRSNFGTVYATPKRIVASGAKLREPKASSVRNAQLIIRAIFAYALAHGHISQAEVPAITVADYVQQARGAFTSDELDILLARLEGRIQETNFSHHQAGRRLLWLYTRFLLLTGIRPGVEAKLRFRDIVEKDGHCVVHVRDGKTGPRSVLANGKLSELMNDIRAQHPDPSPDSYLWTKKNGEKTGNFQQPFTWVLEELGMGKDDNNQVRTLYSLRHTYITRCIEQGRSLNWISKNCGNSQAVIEKNYDHVIHTNQLDQIPD